MTPRTHRTHAVVARAAHCELLERRMLLSLSPIGAEFRVNTFTTSDQGSAAIAADGDGDFVVVWDSFAQDGSGRGIYAQRYNAVGAAQGAEFRVNTFTTGDQRFPAVAMDADGDFVVAWDSDAQDGSSTGIFAQRYNATGVAQGGEFRVNTFTTGEQLVPKVAIDASGDFVVIWKGNGSGDSYGIFARRYNAAGVAQGTEFRVNTFTTGSQRDGAVTMDADGDFVIAWDSSDQDGSSGGIYAQRYDALSVLQGAEFRVNTVTTGNQSTPSVAMDASGDFVVAWTSVYKVFAQRYNAAGVAQGNEFRVNTFTPGAQFGPRIAADADGDFLISWTDGPFVGNGQDGSSFGVYAQSFNAAGVPQGVEFRVNTFTTSSQSGPSVAMDAEGSAVIAWTSNNQEGPGSGHGVYAQRYDESNPDTAAPVVADVIINGQRLLPYSTHQGPLSQIIVSFSENISDAGGPSGPNSVTNPANWLITRNGVNVTPAIAYGFNPAANRFEAVLSFSPSLTDGNFLLKARDNNRDIAGNRLDGNLDGAPGGALLLPFSVGIVPRGGEFRVNTFTTESQDRASTAMDAAGNFVVVWDSTGQDGSGRGVYRQLYNATGGAIGLERIVNTFTTNDQFAASVAMDADGDFVVVWSSYGQDGITEGVYAQRFSALGIAQGGGFRVNTHTPGNQRFPRVAMDAGGNFAVVWTSFFQDGSDDGVYAQRYSAAGVAQGVEFRVNTFTLDDQLSPAIAMDDSGNFAVAWSSNHQDGSSLGVYAKRYNASGVAQGGEFRVNTFIAGNQLNGSVAMDADGDFVVAWASNLQDGSLDGIYAQRYNAAGGALGEEFRVNTTTSNSQFRPAVAMDAAGDFVVAWSSNLQDGSASGVYAQRYGARSTPTVATLTDTPDPVSGGNSVTLSASGVNSAEGSISSVSFYRDSNGDAGLQVGVEGDTLVGTDTTPVGGFWSASASTVGLPGGTYTYFAQAADDVGLTGAPASTTNTVIGAAPAVSASSFVFQTAPHRLRFTFSDNVSASLGTNDLLLENLTTSTTIPSSQLSLTYDVGTNTATFSYTGSAGGFSGVLPNGNYRATLLAAGITNPGGTPLAANHVFTFFFLNGDANHDGRVNLNDFNILAANFGQSPRNFTQGDFTYDGLVNLSDFNILAGRFGQVLANQLAGSPASSRPLPFASKSIADSLAEEDPWADLLA